jgi:hypothetical protein
MAYTRPRIYNPNIETIVKFGESISEREFEIYQAAENALNNNLGLRHAARQLDLSYQTIAGVSSKVRRMIHNINYHVLNQE